MLGSLRLTLYHSFGGHFKNLLVYAFTMMTTWEASQTCLLPELQLKDILMSFQELFNAPHKAIQLLVGSI